MWGTLEMKSELCSSASDMLGTLEMKSELCSSASDMLGTLKMKSEVCISNPVEIKDMDNGIFLSCVRISFWCYR